MRFPRPRLSELRCMKEPYMENILSETAAPCPVTQGEESALPTFSRGFQRTRYAGKDKQATLPKAE